MHTREAWNTKNKHYVRNRDIRFKFWYMILKLAIIYNWVHYNPTIVDSHLYIFLFSSTNNFTFVYWSSYIPLINVINLSGGRTQEWNSCSQKQNLYLFRIHIDLWLFDYVVFLNMISFFHKFIGNSQRPVSHIKRAGNIMVSFLPLYIYLNTLSDT